MITPKNNLAPPDAPAQSERQMTSYAFRIAIVAALGGFLFGYDISIISGALIFLSSEFNLDPYQQGFAVSSAAIGCIAGPLVAVALSDAFGRRRTLVVAALLLGFSAIGTALPRDMLQFNLFRIVGGIGVGLASVVSPMYIAEMAPARLRGRLVSVNQLAIVTGLFIAIVVSYALSFSGSWRWMLASEVIPSVIFLGLLRLVSDSPRWYVLKGHPDKALAVLRRITDEVTAQATLKEIQATLVERTRPLMSFGGSAIAATCVALAILLRIDWEGRQLARGFKV